MEFSLDLAPEQNDDHKGQRQPRESLSPFCLEPTSTQFSRATFLMCSPEWYEVRYIRNPWMAGNVGSVSRDRAFAQWKQLYETLRKIANVRLLQAQPGVPDMTFVGHGALINLGVAALSGFAIEERKPEETYLRRWLTNEGFLPWEPRPDIPFEGEGDAMMSPNGDYLWIAYGPRTSRVSHRHLADAWKVKSAPLHLVDPRFFHLDTCFAPLSGGHIVYFPGAFDRDSLRRINSVYSRDRQIIVSEAEAIGFVCNLVNVGNEIIVHAMSSTTVPNQLRRAGYRVTEVPLDEFLKAGGAAKSLVLRLSDLRVTHGESRNKYRGEDCEFSM